MAKHKRSPYSGNQCFNCGRAYVPATDNSGQPYMGCPVCRVVLAPPEVKPSRTDELEAQLSQAQAEIARLDQAVRDGRTVNAVLARELDAARAKLKETV